MDTITDILSAFFVNSNKNTKKEKEKKKKNKIKKVDKETQFDLTEYPETEVTLLEPTETVIDTVIDTVVKEPTETVIDTVVKEPTETVIDTVVDTVVENKVKEPSEILTEKETVIEKESNESKEIKKETEKEETESNKNIKTKEQNEVVVEKEHTIGKEPSENKNYIKSMETQNLTSFTKDSSNLSKSSSKSSKSLLTDSSKSFKSSQPDSSKSSRSYKSSLTDSSSSSHTRSASTDSSISKSMSEPLKAELKIKKCLSKNEKLLNHNLLIMNKSIDTNLEMLNELLYEHSLIDGCKDNFQKCIYVFSDNSNKLKFKNMFDKNPYLYFTEIKISSKLTANTLKNFKLSNKQTIIIIDGSMDTHIALDILNKLKGLNIHLLYITSNYSISTYKKLNNLFEDSFMILHKNTKSSNEKIFFKNIIDKTFSNVDFDHFLNLDKIMLNKNLLKHF